MRLRMGGQFGLTITLENSLAKALMHFSPGLFKAGKSYAATWCTHKISWSSGFGEPL
jgi:hypothetical protein